MTQAQYQLTRYPIGSFREIWAVSDPLMLSFLSTNLMLFFDRLFLSQYTLSSLTAAVNAGLASATFLMVPMTVGGISEVFVGQYHGSGQSQRMGIPVWQMLWFALLTFPYFWLIGYHAPSLLFNGTGNEWQEMRYFTTLMCFGPFFVSTIVLSGFFIGQGQVSLITWVTLFANLCHIFLDPPLIFGWGPLPALGILGAALATGLTQLFSSLILFTLFLGRKHRKESGSNLWRLKLTPFWECVRIGTPNGLGHLSEMVAHLVFMRIMINAGGFAITVVAIAQSVYILLAFASEGLSKGVSAIASNLIGGRQWQGISSLLKSAILLQTLVFLCLLAICVITPEPVVRLFINEHEQALFQSSEFVEVLTRSSLWMTLFFFFDGLCWVFIGLLTAAGDTKFILFVGGIFNWLFYVLPVYAVITLYGASVDKAWQTLTLYSAILVLTYFWRYRSNRWRTLELSEV